MSVVTNIIITTSIDEFGIGFLNEAMEKIKSGNSFKEVSDHCGGTKAFEAEVWLGAFNYIDLEEFAALAKATEWTYPGDVRIFVKEQDDDYFSPMNIQLS